MIIKCTVGTLNTQFLNNQPVLYSLDTSGNVVKVMEHAALHSSTLYEISDTISELDFLVLYGNSVRVDDITVQLPL